MNRKFDVSFIIRWMSAIAFILMIAVLATPAQATGVPDSFADLAERLLPAVVNISTTQTIKNADREMEMPQFPPGSPFEEFFKDFMERQKGNQDHHPQKATALGSGFIIDPAGLVVTNNHVIAEADEITVILHDGSAYKAELVGRDEKADLAVLRIKTPNKLPAIAFGDSDEARVGDWVIAIGNPLGFGGTVTAGIISARSRNINAGPYDDFIQTDAAINKGNSGGPLFNMKGEVIGINAAIFSQTGGSIGIGFSIPSNLAKPVIADLQKFGKTHRGWLGVHIQTVTDDIADNLGLKDHKGALIADVTPNGPAAKAGIKSGDVIIKFDGKDVQEMHRLPRMVAETAVGKEVDVTVLRDGKTMDVKLVLGELPDDDAGKDQGKGSTKAAPKKDTGQTTVDVLGLSVAPVSQTLRERYDLPADVKGVVVTDVNPDGTAAEQGIRPGDLIVDASQEPIKTPADLTAKVDAARKAGHKSILVLVQSEGALHFVPIKIDSSGKSGKTPKPKPTDNDDK